MSTTLQMNAAGTLTLPDEIRRQFGLEGPATVEVELTREGILIRPPRRYPVETYTDERVAEFEQNNEAAVRDYLHEGIKVVNLATLLGEWDDLRVRNKSSS